jgi:endonuclease/exonuclease/phosphatase family metal-dependent hydrolase
MSLRILTWNISFGAMTGLDLDKTSIPLPEKCREKFIVDEKGISITQCLFNVVNTIDESAKSKPYDFVALQEATNWDIIFSKSKELQRMGGYVNHLANFEDMATFYDANKYTLLAVKVGNLLPGNGRPYQILFLQNNNDKSYYIFINLHNGHEIIREELEQKLSADLHIGFKSSANLNNLKIDVDLVDLSDIIKDKDFKVIMAGDFNDHGHYNYWRELRPFSQTSFVNLKDLIVKATSAPPLTCCAPINLPMVRNTDEHIYYDKISRNIRKERSGYDTMFGDYILVSENLSVVVDNRVLLDFEYNAEEFPTSDHLPVEIVLTSKTDPKSPNGDVKYKEKYLKYKQKYLELKKTLF